MARSKRHAHKYFRRELYGIGRVWQCAIPSCNHYMPPHISELVVGKLATCNECEQQYLLTREKMESDFPVCDDCETIHVANMRRIRERKDAQDKEVQRRLDNNESLDDILKGVTLD